VGQPVEILVPEDTRRLHARHRDRYLAQPRSRPMGAGTALAGRRSDGGTFPAEISLSTIHTGDGVYIAAAVRDLTERRQAAETVRRLAAIVQSSPVAVIGKTTGQIITSWNPAAERLYGYRASEMIGQHIGVLIPPEDQERELEILASIVRGTRLEGHQAQRMCKDGSRLTVSLTMFPITDSTGKITGSSTTAPGGSGETILLVEDEAALREATRHILTRHGYDVLAAGSGPEALELLGRHGGPVDLLLTDVVMPQMPGSHLADRVRATWPGIRVLFMSGYTRGLLSAQGVLEPGVHLIEKPFDRAALLTKVNEVLHALG
jgi:PAS domain S-box-containing protein